eukprot:5922684-Amphidinium_carterae.1
MPNMKHGFCAERQMFAMVSCFSTFLTMSPSTSVPTARTNLQWWRRHTGISRWSWACGMHSGKYSHKFDWDCPTWRALNFYCIQAQQRAE